MVTKETLGIFIPRYKACTQTRLKRIMGARGNVKEVGEQCDGFAKLDDTVYHSLNTGEPYMLRHCPKCSTSCLIIPK